MYTSSDPTRINTDDNSLNDIHPASSAVSWAAIFAGATAAAALSLILLILGTGLGMSSISPWAQEGVSATTFGVSTIIWITFMSIAASGVGGYLAGRLRTKWVGTHTDEVYFRDTAHGLLAWAIATLVTAALLTSAVGSIVAGGVKAGASLTGGVTSVATNMASTASNREDNNEDGITGYFVDSLFRNDAAEAGPSPASTEQIPTPTDQVQSPGETGSSSVTEGQGLVAQSQIPAQQNEGSNRQDLASRAVSTAEAGRIFMNSLWRDDDLPDDDLRYLGQIVAERTDLSQQEAQARVADTYTRLQTRLAELEEEAKAAADTAREASAYASLWFFISLLSGAFVAALAATWGGRQRDF